VDIDEGKTLVIRCAAVGETNEDGMVRVFFELNGQPRSIQVPDRIHGAVEEVQRARAEADNPLHVGAPMPGVVSTVAVQQGQEVAEGDVLLSIEAMKMETAIYAETAGTVAELLVAPGARIDAKDLLVRLETSAGS
ncbi:MAG: pyruvate carboxylase, partial [Gammaproteobacteria bacterium]